MKKLLFIVILGILLISCEKKRDRNRPPARPAEKVEVQKTYDYKTTFNYADTTIVYYADWVSIGDSYVQLSVVKGYPEDVYIYLPTFNIRSWYYQTSGNF